jgi:hypothetical protein
MKAYGGAASFFLNLSTRRRWVLSFMPQPLPRGHSLWFPLNRRLGGPEGHAGSTGEKVLVTRLPLPRIDIRFLRRTALSLVPIPTTKPRLHDINICVLLALLIPVAARSKAWICGRSLAGIAVLNPARGLDVCVCCECCVLSGRGLCVGPITRPEESYWVRCVWVWLWSIDNEEAQAH